MIAVLGLGSIGMRHARNLMTLGEGVVGYDPDPERCALLESDGGQIANTRAGALKSAEAVIIASPSHQHLDDMITVIDAGCHMFVEKPLAHKTTGLEEQFERTAKSSLVIFPALILRFHPALEAARKMLAENKLGTVLWARLQMSDYLPSWRPDQDHRTGYASNPLSGGVLFDLIHEFDVANFLLGPASTVNSAARNTGLLGLESEDCADVVLRHESGVLSSMHFDYVTRPRIRTTEIAASNGVLRVDLDERHLIVEGPKGNIIVDKIYPGSYQDDFLAQMKTFLSCIKSGQNDQSRAFEALNVLNQVIDARKMAGLKVEV